MAISLLHAFVSAKAQSANPDIVSKNAWDEEHKLLVDASCVVGKSGTTAGPAETMVASVDDLVFRRVGGLLGFGSIDLSKAATVGSSRLALTNIIAGAALSVLGVTGAATADHADIVGTTDQVLRVNSAGNALGFGTIATGGIANAAITYAKIQNVAGNSVFGRAANSAGVGADITASTNGHFLRLSGATLGFGNDINGNLSVLGAQGLTVSPLGNSAISTLTSFNLTASRVSNTTREFMANLGLTSTTGSGASGNNKDGVTLYSSVSADTSSGNVWAGNFLVEMKATLSSNINAQGIELDFNNFKADYTSLSPIAAGLSISGAGTFLSSAALYITGTISSGGTLPIWTMGLVMTGPSIRDYSILDQTNSVYAHLVQGTHTNGIDLSGATISGNAFSSSGFVVTGAGVEVLGLTAPSAKFEAGTVTPKLQVHAADATGSFGVARYSADASSSKLYVGKSRHATPGSHTIVQASDVLGEFDFAGSDGTNFINAAQISGVVDGTPGASNDMPGRLVFSTTADGSGTLSERMRIASTGVVTIGGLAASATFDGGGVTPRLQVHGVDASSGAAGIARYSADASSPKINLAKSRNAAVGSHTIVQLDDLIGTINFSGSDGTNFQVAAQITGSIDATPGASNDMPGRLVFSTVPDGTLTLTERLRIDNGGTVVVGGLAASSKFDGGGFTPRFQIHAADSTAALGFARYQASNAGPTFNLGKSRNATLGSHTIVQSGDVLGAVNFSGSDGTNFITAAQISVAVDGTPGASNDMPGRLSFYTTPDGSGTLAERFRIDNTGKLFIGAGNIELMPSALVTAKLIAVNFNSANSDTSFTVTYPPGYTRARLNSVVIAHASASLTTATCSVFSGAGGTGVAMISNPTAITVSTASDATLNNAQAIGGLNVTVTATTLFFRVLTAQGSAATGDVEITLQFCP